MSSSFTGLYSATSGLYASQTAMAVTTNNISNANTEGYSRKTITQSAIGPAAVYISSVSTGSGVQVTSVERARDELLDEQYWEENSVATEWSTKATYLSSLEDTLEDIDGDGLSTLMDDFATAMEDLAGDPSSTEARTAMQQAGVAVCDYLNSMATSLADLREQMNEEVKTSVDEINSYSKQIAALNTQIQQVAAAGGDASDLEDQRDVLIDSLSALVDIEVSETKVATSVNGDSVTTLVISIDGDTLVNGGNCNSLECVKDDEGMYQVQWSDSGETMSPESGQLGALLELRDGSGENGEYKGVVYYMNQLDEYAQTLAEAFNEGTTSYDGHTAGYDADGDTGICFFSYNGEDSATLEAAGYTAVTAANISLSAEVLADVSNIATATAADESENAEGLQDLIDLLDSDELFGDACSADFLDALTVTFGTQSSYATTQSDRHDTILNTIDSSRDSVSSVSTNEETTNLVLYQEAYAASAKAVSMWQQLYQDMLDMVSS